MKELQIQLNLHFNGPYKYTKEKEYLFDSKYAKSEGIYIWTIKDLKSGNNFIHYIGETTSFAKRHKEHLIQITGLNYRIINHEKAEQGIHEVIWDGLWRDKTKSGPAELINKYSTISNSVIGYLRILNVYFAPTNLPKDIRKHIEGSIAKKFKRSYPELNLFYPKDNRTGMKKDKLDKTIVISSDERIAGLDLKYEI